MSLDARKALEARKTFHARFNKATKAPAKLKIAKKKPEIEFSISTVLSNYEKQMVKALNSHAITKEECDAICKKINELQPLVKNAQSKAGKFLTNKAKS